MTVQITGAWNFPTRVITGPGRIAELPEACRTYGALMLGEMAARGQAGAINCYDEPLPTPHQDS